MRLHSQAVETSALEGASYQTPGITVRTYGIDHLVVHFRNNCGVAMSPQPAYSRSVRSESRTYLANGLAAWLVPHLATTRRSPLNSWNSVEVLSVGERSCVLNIKGRDWLSYSTNPPTCPTSQPGRSWGCIPTPSGSGDIVGRVEISPWLSKQAAGRKPVFSPSRPGDHQGDRLRSRLPDQVAVESAIDR